MHDALFYIFATLALGCGIMVLLSRNPVTSAMFLVLTIVSLAGLFVLLHAFFLAAVQILVYAGAVMVLFLFVIMLLNLGRASGDLKGLVASAVATVLGIGLLLDLRPISHAGPPDAIVLPAGALDSMLVHQGVVGSVAGPLFDTYLVPFEITSLLLTAAIVGAVVLAKRKL
jgi:NADH-quinone oxidoreductase subunit J